MDDKSREDILQGEELISYLSKYEIWLARYNRWIDSFPDDGIELRPWKKTARELTTLQGFDMWMLRMRGDFLLLFAVGRCLCTSSE